MNEYQISVSRNGRFLFRTDWMDSSYYAEASSDIADRFLPANGFKVVAHSRSKLMTQIELQPPEPGPSVYVDSDTLSELREQLVQQRINTAGHGRRARIQEQIDAIDAELEDRTNQKHAANILSS